MPDDAKHIIPLTKWQWGVAWAILSQTSGLPEIPLHQASGRPKKIWVKVRVLRRFGRDAAEAIIHRPTLNGTKFSPSGRTSHLQRIIAPVPFSSKKSELRN